MAGPNTNATGEGFEANENNAPNNENKYSKLIKSYIEKKLNNQDDRLEFAKKIKSATTIPEDIITEIESHKGTSAEFAGLEINTSTISLSSLQNELGSFLVGVESKKTSLRSTFLQEYDISAQDYTKYLSGKINDISKEEDLRQLLDSDISRDEFLKNIYKKGVPKRRLIVNILKDMNIEKRYSQLEDHLEREFMDTVAKMQRRETLETSDFMVLFESKIFSTLEKQKLIETFMPSISIADALKLDIIDNDAVNSIKEKALEASLDTGLFNGVNLDAYISGIQDEELIFSTQGLFSTAKSQEKLFEQNFFFKKFKKDFDIMLQKIEADLASQSIQTVKEMREILTGISHIKGIENFKEGSTLIIKQDQKDASGSIKEVTLYAEIASIASAGTFVLKERGINEYNTRETKSTRNTYSEFIDYATKGNIPQSVECITSETLKHRIQTGEIRDLNDAGRFEDKASIEADKMAIVAQIEAREKELRDTKVPKSQWENDEKLQNLYKIRDEKEEILSGVEAKNQKTLTEAIDALDKDGKKFEMKVGTSFVTDEGKGDVFSITNLNEMNQTLVVRGLENDEPISYQAFIEAFESQKAKRVSCINDFKELFSQTDGAYKSWGGFELKDGNIRSKTSKLKVNYDYLAPPAGSDAEMLKIHEIDGTMVTMSFGKINDQKKFDKKEKKDKRVGEIFSIEKQEYRVSIGVLDHYIRNNKLEPRSLEEGKVKEEEMNSIPKPASKFGFANWFFQGMSLAAVIKGGKTAIEQIKNSLNEGDDEKANAFALKMFGPFLGKNGRTDLQARLEQTQKKSMDEAIERLKGINSGIATEMIGNWLLDPRTPEYMKEAGMFYMFEKYGALCAKKLYKYQGQYFWYQKMGGRIGDSNWVEVHEKNDKDPKQNTTEEQLVYELIRRQTKPGGYNGIQRRSKLDKELKAKRGQGKEEEWAKGKKDGDAERDIRDRLSGGLGEMSSGNYPNAMGWFETVVNKGGSMKDMNMIPFVMMFSGMAYHFEKDLVDKFKNFPSESKMIMMVRFMSYPGDIDLVNDTIVDICKNLKEKGGKYSNIYEEAKQIRNNSKDSGKLDIEKQENTIKFYEKYGEELTKILYMLNTGDKDDIDNKMIFFEKDTNSNFHQYYEKMEGFTGASETNFGKDEIIMSDSFAYKGTSGLNIYRAAKQLLELRTSGAWVKHESGPIMWKEIIHEFEAIPKRQYDPDPVKNEQMQRKLLESNLRQFLSAIVSLNTDTKATSSYNSPIGYFSRLNDWGVYFDDLLAVGASTEAIKGGGHTELIHKFIDGIISYSNGGASKKRPYKVNDDGRYEYIQAGKQTNTISVSDLIQGKTQKIIQNPPRPANINTQLDDD